MYKMIDLCAGIGGIRRGFEMTGKFKNVLSAEIDETACKAYKHLYNEDPKNDLMSDSFKDKVAAVDYDILLAGFPCQTFSRAGKQEGFKNTEKGTIFYHIVNIISRTKPKGVFLENVDHLVTHNKGKTFREIVEKLDEVGYNIIGVHRDENEKLVYDPKSFVRNSRNFGIPQNRPRIYIMAFRKDLCTNKKLPKQTPHKSEHVIYKDLNDLLDKKVNPGFFMSEGYLETLEKHAVREKNKGNGFGYKIVNPKGKENPIANTILATGGSGKERNLIYDEVNGKLCVGKIIGLKKSPVNKKHIRVMTPNEWGKLQGFVNYAFMENGKDTFSLPEDIPVTQRYKLFGNAVTVPVIKEMADCMYKILVDIDA